ncbi:SpoIIE family protein phosphatase [Peptoniphilus sp. oral taxon 386]|uniref:SpoIIE family protein phosphatase n=2 Tax=Peptoniphilus TaxID=162289 RepID=UPI0020D20A8A|nr:SpoIIE family protein phosphatase [Peptoniphilus sp. oral taxon 386]
MSEVLIMNKPYKDSILNKDKLNYKILDGIVDLVRVLNTDNDVVFANKAMREMLGHDNNNMVCKLNESILDPRITKRTLETGEVIQREEMIDNKYFSVKCSPVIGMNNEILGVVEVFRNISMERKLVSEIIEKNEMMTVEMTHAQKIQQALLPEKGMFENLKIDYIYRPSNMLSGDMFDIIKINDDNVGIYIADTVGHGFASSMVTMFIRLVMRNIPNSKLLYPSKTLTEIWNRFSALKLDIELYFTCFYGVYNIKTNKLTYSNAGHFPYPIIFRGDEIIELEANGFPITRFLKGVTYADDSIKLSENDKLLFMTDGITETKNKNSTPFGTSRVKKIITENNGSELTALEKGVYKFMWGEQKDDITALLIELQNLQETEK